jgi:nanoRNase/pAp phosphatase (c-di-AMP/oligoRNAs hydrolase)
MGGKDVLVVNSPHWMSEIGAALSPKCDFAVIWFYDHETRQVKVSLRAHHEDSDVSEVAKRFGGGGHRKAAGFNLPANVSIESIFDEVKNG